MVQFSALWEQASDIEVTNWVRAYVGVFVREAWCYRTPATWCQFFRSASRRHQFNYIMLFVVEVWISLSRFLVWRFWVNFSGPYIRMQLGVANVSDLAGCVSVTVIVFDNFRVYWQGLIPRGFPLCWSLYLFIFLLSRAPRSGSTLLGNPQITIITMGL